MRANMSAIVFGTSPIVSSSGAIGFRCFQIGGDFSQIVFVSGAIASRCFQSGSDFSYKRNRFGISMPLGWALLCYSFFDMNIYWVRLGERHAITTDLLYYLFFHLCMIYVLIYHHWLDCSIPSWFRLWRIIL